MFPRLLKNIGALALLALLASGTTACETNPVVDPPVKEPLSRVYFEDYDEVWRAIQLAVRKYPVRLNNIESGTLETDYIKGNNLYTDPVAGRERPGQRYKITIRAIKGKKNDHPAVKVTVQKTAEVQPDFFTGFVQVPSYGLEENVILYRVGRYLELDKILAKSANQQN